jgi:hypothetical protein
VTVVPSPYLPPEPWWDVELWNKQVDRALGVNGATTYTSFPAERAMVDPRSGELAVAHPTPLLVLSARETRFGLRGAREVAGNFALRLVRVAVPYRAAWSTLGTTPDGWTRPGWSVRLRLYSDAKSRQRRAVALTLSAAQFPTRHRYHLFAAGQQLASGRVGPLSSRTTRVSICVPAGGFADVTLDVLAVDQLPDGRLAGLHIDRVEEAGAGPCR